MQPGSGRGPSACTAASLSTTGGVSISNMHMHCCSVHSKKVGFEEVGRLLFGIARADRETPECNRCLLRQASQARTYAFDRQ